MKKFTFILLALTLAACNPSKQDQSSDAPSEHAKVRQNFIQSCTDSAVGSDTSNNAKRDYAKSICECVYNEGITSYGGEKEWVNELNAIEKNQKVSDTLNQFSDKAIASCVSKNPPSNTATASQPK